jgi:hypothetical protein
MAWFSLCERYNVKIKNIRGVNMGIIYVDEEYLKAVGYLINEKEQDTDSLINKLRKIAVRGARAVKTIHIGPVDIDPSRIRNVPEILGNMQAAKEYLESSNLKNHLSDVINDVLNQKISDFDILSIICNDGIKGMVDSYDENGDSRPTFKDASFLYFYESGLCSFLNNTCIGAKLMSFKKDTRLFFKCYFRKMEKIKVLFERNPRYSVTIFGIVYDDSSGEYLIKRTIKRTGDSYQKGKKALLVVAASGEEIDPRMDVINRSTFLSQ